MCCCVSELFDDVGKGCGHFLEAAGVDGAFIADFVELESASVIFVFGGKLSVGFYHAGDGACLCEHHFDGLEGGDGDFCKPRRIGFCKEGDFS